MKECKKQVLAALALMLALGMAMPVATFASSESGFDFQAMADGEDFAVGDSIILFAASKPQSNADNLMTLVKQISEDDNFGKYQNLYAAQTKLAQEISEGDVLEADFVAVQNAILALYPSAQIKDMNHGELNNYVLNLRGYKDWVKAIDVLTDLASRTDTSIKGITADLIEQNMTQTEIKKAYDELTTFVNRITGTLSDNVAKLYARVNLSNGFKGYQEAVGLIEAYEAAARFNVSPRTFFSDPVYIYDNELFWDVLSAADQKAVSNLDVAGALEYLITRNRDSVSVSDVLTGMQAELNKAYDNLLSAVESAIPTANLPEEPTLAQVMTEAQSMASFNNYKALYDSGAFIRQAINDNTKTPAQVCGTYTSTCAPLATIITGAYGGNQGELMKRYATMLNAAVLINSDVQVGLMTSVMPDTSVGTDDKNPSDSNNGGGEDTKKPTIPESGIIGLIESGAIDMSTVILIASVAVASIAGIGLIAKLYLKHKF